MTAKQARRIAMWMNGQYLIAVDHTGLSDDEVATLSEADMDRLMTQQRAIGLEMIKRSGIDADTNRADVIAAVLGTSPSNQQGS